MPNRYSEDLIAQILAANDIVSVVSQYAELKRSGSGGYVARCPFHREKTPSFHISEDKQLYHCFGCGVGGSVLQFIMAAENLDFPDAVKYLADRANIPIPESGAHYSDDSYKRKKQLYALNVDAARFFYENLNSPDGTQARAYLRSRGLSDTTITSFGLGFAPDTWDSATSALVKKGYSKAQIVMAGIGIQNDKGHVYDRFRNRVMFPIFDVRGNIIAFGGRALKNEGAKYINSPESPIYSKGRNLFALNLAKKNGTETIVLVEGYMDVITLHQNGIKSAVAGCGTALTAEQARLLSRYAKTVCLCYDTDDAGRKAAERAFEMFDSLDCRVRVISVPGAKDPDEYVRTVGGEPFQKLIDEAKTVAQYRIDSLFSKYNLSDAAEKADFALDAARILLNVKNAVERDEYKKSIALRADIDIRALEDELRRLNRKNARRTVSEEVRKSVAPKTRGTQIALGDIEVTDAAKNAQSALIRMVVADKSVYNAVRDDFCEDLFADEFLRSVARYIKELYSERGVCDEAAVFAHFASRESLLAQVFVARGAENASVKAAKDCILRIRRELLDAKIKAAEKAGDFALLQKLISESKNLMKGG
ncbi:MAG: DNA primase [Clostridia bacterium]|nr:DNA primase [Clostridia bacterium]